MSVTSGHNQSKHLHRFNKTHGPTRAQGAETGEGGDEFRRGNRD
jgi:hypothetical protein